MFVRVRVIVGERNGLLVPEEAIVPQGEEFYVFKVVDGAAKRVPVKIGVRRDAKVEIVEGIAAGDQVVTAGMRLSRDGQSVRVLSPAGGKGDAGKGDAGKADAARGDAAKGGAAPARDGAGKV
jgi:membrane fusion protein (multidrug efflux system)